MRAYIDKFSMQTSCHLKGGFHSGNAVFYLVLCTPRDQKKWNILQLFIIRVLSGLRIACSNWNMRGFNFVPMWSNPMLIFLCENRSSRNMFLLVDMVVHGVGYRPC